MVLLHRFLQLAKCYLGVCDECGFSLLNVDNIAIVSAVRRCVIQNY